MISDILDFVLVAVFVPLVVGETADLAPLWPDG